MEQITALAKLPKPRRFTIYAIICITSPVRNVAYAVKAVAEKNEEVA